MYQGNFEIFFLILGNIRNTQKVYYKDRHNFILKIIAQDCGGKPSKAVFVNILVKEKCRPQWTSKGEHQTDNTAVFFQRLKSCLVLLPSWACTQTRLGLGLPLLNM